MKILLFGITRDLIGQEALEIREPDAASLHTVEALKRHLLDQYPALDQVSSLAIAVNSDYAQGNDPVSPSDEIALIPPVSGG